MRVPELYGGPGYAHASVAAGTTLFTAGACPVDAEGKVVCAGDVAAQMRYALANLRATLHAAGASFEDVCKTTVYVATTERQDLLTAWHEVEKALTDSRPPSTLLGVTVLGYPDQLVEIEAIAVVPA